MTVRVEVWPLAADDLGIWLVSGEDAWRPSLPVMSDSEPHAEVELELASRGVKEHLILLHSPSWRPDGPSMVVTYVAVLQPNDLVIDTWPAARPMSTTVVDQAGLPGPGPTIDPPTPRYIDVLMHAVRHLRFLLDNDAGARGALAEPWPRHLAQFEAALAMMYEDPPGAA